MVSKSVSRPVGSMMVSWMVSWPWREKGLPAWPDGRPAPAPEGMDVMVMGQVTRFSATNAKTRFLAGLLAGFLAGFTGLYAGLYAGFNTGFPDGFMGGFLAGWVRHGRCHGGESHHHGSHGFFSKGF